MARMSAVTRTAGAGCPVADAVAEGAAHLAHPALDRTAAELAAPPRVGVLGRPGGGRATVERALRGVGVATAGAGEQADLTVYVFVETLTPEDRDAIAGLGPCVAVLTKADLSGFGGSGPMATAGDRCRALQRSTGVPTVPLAGLVAAASVPGLEPDVAHALVGLSRGGDVPPGLRQRLLADLDLFGIATAVSAVRDGAGPDDLGAALRRVSGLEPLLAAIERAAAPVRYLRAAEALDALARLATGSRAIADLLAGDAVVLARMASARAVLEAAGLAVRIGDSHTDLLRAAIAWERYGHGPVSELHRACAADITRGALRLWSRADT